MAELTEWHLEKSLISKMPKSCEDIKSAEKTRTFKTRKQEPLQTSQLQKQLLSITACPIS
jgi:hypothetical protein